MDIRLIGKGKVGTKRISRRLRRKRKGGIMSQDPIVVLFLRHSSKGLPLVKINYLQNMSCP